MRCWMFKIVFVREQLSVFIWNTNLQVIARTGRVTANTS
jgi:hypothetical protein